MSETQSDESQPLILVTPAPGEQSAGTKPAERPFDGESVERPAKVMRIGSMIKQLLDEVEKAPLDSASRSRLKEIYERSVAELADGLSPELVDELDRLALPFESEEPSDAELRIAQAQLVGWLEGLFHGIQAALFAQQLAAQSQLDEMRRRSLPAGSTEQPPAQERPGPYL
ncbi:MAG: proteasome activator [Acidimicrobiales bacterium]